MRFTFCIDENVARLDVSMKNAVLMRMMNCVRQFGDEFRRIASGDWLELGRFIELSAVDELHAEVAGLLAFAHFVNGNDALMIQAGGRLGFQTETLHVRFRGPLAEPNDF